MAFLNLQWVNFHSFQLWKLSESSKSGILQWNCHQIFAFNQYLSQSSWVHPTSDELSRILQIVLKFGVYISF